MTAALAHGAYKSTTKATASPRAIECQVLMRINMTLIKAEDQKDQNYPAYVQALGDNLKFWTIIGTDVSKEENELPKELRAQLFYLFEYTRLHTSKLLKRDADLTAAALIDINNNIIEGLKGNSSERAA